MAHVFDNGNIRIEFASDGSLLSLGKSGDGGWNYVRPHCFWRLIISEGSSLEVEVVPQSGKVAITGTCEDFTLHYSDLHTIFGQPVDIQVTVSGRMQGEDLLLSLEVENHLPAGDMVRECHFPVLCLSEAAEQLSLHYSNAGGTVWSSVAEHKYRLTPGGPQYQSMDFVYERQIYRYPGLTAATNCFALASDNGGLYVGSHDLSFEYTEHVFELEKRQLFNLLMVKTPFLPSGGKRRYDGYVLSPYDGRWFKAADKYRAWAETWYEFKPIPERIRTMQGWQRLIMRTQYGENSYPFATLPQIYADGAAAGIDSLLMFGWHQGGHDCDYPEYIPARELGGKESMRENIRKFQELGGQVFLYANGNLIDKNSEFYLQGKGKKASVKDFLGNETSENWCFSGRGVANRTFGNRSFVTACPASREWLDKLKEYVDLAVEVGADGVFFDQVGAGARVCCDQSHGHPVPYFGVMNARRDLVAEMRRYAHSKKPGMSIGIEHTTDITAQHADYIHTCGGGNTVVNPGWEQRGEKPHIENDYRWFRYIFPEVILSNRNIRDNREIEMRVNRMLLLNLVSDVEVYRCQRTVASEPYYQQYLGAVNAFRYKHRALLYGARYRADSLQQNTNPEIDSESHIAPSGQIVVLATQSHLESATTRISVAGRQLQAHDFLGQGELLPDGSLRLSRHTVALLVFA
ncbi:MAG: endo alpha-1,4 polygalactosaminidase [Lentisphaerae bacterium]|jgi:hypothetical protein|nr:endo alpha-1,4 polygalactosaminidase [Lentisphaerota bacterium]